MPLKDDDSNKIIVLGAYFCIRNRKTKEPVSFRTKINGKMPYPAHKWLFCVQNTGLQQRIYEYKKKNFKNRLQN